MGGNATTAVEDAIRTLNRGWHDLKELPDNCRLWPAGIDLTDALDDDAPWVITDGVFGLDYQHA